ERTLIGLMHGDTMTVVTGLRQSLASRANLRFVRFDRIDMQVAAPREFVSEPSLFISQHQTEATRDTAPLQNLISRCSIERRFVVGWKRLGHRYSWRRDRLRRLRAETDDLPRIRTDIQTSVGDGQAASLAIDRGRPNLTPRNG